VSKIHKGDDAKSVQIVPMRSVVNLNLAFDHKAILMDYIQRYHPQLK
jgi:hypothetical protein